MPITIGTPTNLGLPAPNPNATYAQTTGTLDPAPTPTKNVYWIGNDGNVWYKSSMGITNMGKPMSVSDAGFDAERGSAAGSQIANPVPTKTATDTDLTPGGNASSAPVYKDTSASRNATQVSIDSLGTIRDLGLSDAKTDKDNIDAQYATEDAENLAKYNTDVENNEITLDDNKHSSLLAAANGSRGLRATMASLGAYNGTGKLLANRAISNEANIDLGAGEKSFKTNAGTLFDARGIVEKEERQRKLDAQRIYDDTVNNVEYDNLVTNQKLANDMAGFWSEAGNFGEANNWTNKASSFTPQIASKTKKAPAQYATKSLTYSAPELNKYLGGMNSTAVNVAAPGPAVNGSIYASTGKKKDKELV